MVKFITRPVTRVGSFVYRSRLPDCGLPLFKWTRRALTERPGPPISLVLEGSLLLRPPHILRTFLSGPLFLFLFLVLPGFYPGNKMPRESPSAIILALAELSEFSNSAKGCEDTSSKCCGAINGRYIMDGVRTQERQRSRSVRPPFTAFHVPLHSSRGFPRVNLIRPLLWFNAAHTEQCESSYRSKRAWYM